MATSAWFDYNAYMANKLAQVQKAEPAANWDMMKLVNAFAAAGYAGDTGAEKHFTEHGQYEDVAPNAFFNATEYFRAKAAQFYDKAPKAVTDLDVANMQAAIENAGMSAWSHYELFGNTEGVNPSNSFDTEAYMNAKLTALNSVVDGKQWTLPELNEAFKAAGLSALEHFMTYGGNGAGEVAQKYDGKIPAAFAVPEDKKVNPDANVGKTIPLTAGFDDLTGTAGNDTFVAADNDGSATLNAGDKVDGGAGTDTLKIFASGGSANFANADIKNVEIVRMVGGTAGDVINVSGNADVEELWFDGGAMGTATLTVDQKLGFAGTVTAAAVTYAGSLDGTTDSVTLAFDKATVTALTVDKIENLTFEFSGKNTLNTITAASAATLTIEGNGEATVTVSGNTGLMESVDTTGFAGDLSLSFGVTVAADFAYTGGAGIDDLTLLAHSGANYNINLGAGDDSLTLGTDATGTTFGTTAKIDGGEGYDTLSIGTAYSAADFKLVSNFEALAITTGAAQDVSLFTGTDIVLGATAATTFTLADLRADQSITLTSTGGTVELTYKAGTGVTPERTVNLLLDDMNDATLVGVTLSDLTNTDKSVKTLNITSEGTVHGVAIDSTHASGANVITSIAGAAGLKTVNIDGTSDLFFTTGAVEGLTVNAGEFTGNLIFVGTASTGALTVTGGSGNDHITGSTLADKLVGGDGDDTLVAGTCTAATDSAGWDVLEGGKGIDAFNVLGITAAGTGASDYKAAMVTINDFEKGETITITANAATAITKYDGTATSFEDIVNAVVKEAAGSLKWFTLDGDTYIVSNNAGATAGDSADQVIKLAGVHDLSDASYANNAADSLGVITW